MTRGHVAPHRAGPRGVGQQVPDEGVEPPSRLRVETDDRRSGYTFPNTTPKH